MIRHLVDDDDQTRPNNVHCGRRNANGGRQFDTEIHDARCIINYTSQVNIDITARGR